MVHTIKISETSYQEYLEWLEEMKQMFEKDVFDIGGSHWWVEHVASDEELYTRNQNGFEHHIDCFLRDAKISLNPVPDNKLEMPVGCFHYTASFVNQKLWRKETNDIYKSLDPLTKAVVIGTAGTSGYNIRVGAIMHRGATDEELSKFLGQELGIGGGSCSDEVWVDHKGGTNFHVFIKNAGGKEVNLKLEGMKLVKEFRKIFSIPETTGIKQMTLF